MMPRLTVAVLALGAVSACADKSSLGTAAVSVSAVLPGPNSTGAAPADTVRLTLDMPMDSASVVTRFTLHMGDSAGPAVPGRMMFGSGYRQMMFVPDSPMQSGTRYFAQMRDGVMMGATGSSSQTGGMMGGGAQMMLTGQMPPGAMRMTGGMGWSFMTGN